MIERVWSVYPECIWANEKSSSCHTHCILPVLFHVTIITFISGSIRICFKQAWYQKSNQQHLKRNIIFFQFHIYCRSPFPINSLHLSIKIFFVTPVVSWVSHIKHGKNYLALAWIMPVTCNKVCLIESYWNVHWLSMA